MRARTLILFVIALTLAGGTAMVVRSFLQRPEAEQQALAKPAAPQKSVLVARGAIARGQILKPQDFSWQVWPEGDIDKSYIVSGTRNADSFACWVARDPLAAGEPIKRCQNRLAGQPRLSRGGASSRHARDLGAGH
jgi:Flp pilus assembly protein CpaB